MGSETDFDLDAALEAVFARHCIDDPDQQQRVVRRARRELEDQAVRDACRLFQQAAGIAARWQPHSEPLDWPVPARPAVRERVLRWARSRADFSVRDLMRSTDWFDRAADAKECLEELVAAGHFEKVPSSRARGRRKGRPPGQHYRRRPPRTARPEENRATGSFEDVLGDGETLKWPTSTADLLHPTQPDKTVGVERRAWPAP